ncbi:hypothetical protein RHSIM_Rhsim05G0182500 [Rhododendron simsii]|uniref:Uncharacterized protein n=1 Tax=Rhododendron simsii TaxID=118357 RepID=A0A834GYQ9_RHOSS|nr:hypothetical protein RHSIM_Rhsim05G0182500 [Rhododendron simsii]
MLFAAKLRLTDPKYNLHNALLQCHPKSPSRLLNWFQLRKSCHCRHPSALAFLVLQFSKSHGICNIKG